MWSYWHLWRHPLVWALSPSPGHAATAYLESERNVDMFRIVLLCSVKVETLLMCNAEPWLHLLDGNTLC